MNPKKGEVWAAISSRGVIQGKVTKVDGDLVTIGGVVGRAFRPAGATPRARPARKKAKRKPAASAGYTAAPARPRKKAKKKRAKKAPRCPSCNRSPCECPGFDGLDYDPKVHKEKIDAARKIVARSPGKKLHQEILFKIEKGAQVPRGTGKGSKFKPRIRKTRGVHRPKVGCPLTIAYGLGVDSTAILVGLVQQYHAAPAREKHLWKPHSILFADVGAEKPETYAYLKTINAYLRRNGFPEVTVVCYQTRFMSGSWASALTLEQQCLSNHALSSISENMGRKSKCSSLWKHDPQNLWDKEVSGLWEKVGREWRVKGSKWIVKAIGYDCEEGRRLAPDGGGSGSTFRVTDAATKKKSGGYWYWYPLIEWGWDRARCRAEIEKAIKKVCPKSSCFFCQAMKPEEVVSLPADLIRRGIFMELVRRNGRQAYRYRWLVKQGVQSADPKKGVKGIGGSWGWTELFTQGAMKSLEGKYSEERRARLDRWITKRRLHMPAGELARLDRLAKQWVASSADKGKSLSLTSKELLKKLKWSKARALKDPMNARSFYGRMDVRELPIAGKIEAYTNLLGFRSGADPGGGCGWERNPPSIYTTDTFSQEVDLFGIAVPPDELAPNPPQLWLPNADTGIRHAHRAWVQSPGDEEAFRRVVAERERAGLMGPLLQHGSRAVLSAWPRTKQGGLKPKITFEEANRVIRAYYRGMGWVSPREAELAGAAIPSGMYYWEFHPGELLSPDLRFKVFVPSGGKRHVKLSEWKGPNVGWWTPARGARWELGLMDGLAFGWRVQKKGLAHELLKRALRSQDPTLPNPWGW